MQFTEHQQSLRSQLLHYNKNNHNYISRPAQCSLLNTNSRYFQSYCTIIMTNISADIAHFILLNTNSGYIHTNIKMCGSTESDGPSVHNVILGTECRVTWRHIPEGRRLHIHRCENLNILKNSRHIKVCTRPLCFKLQRVSPSLRS